MKVHAHIKILEVKINNELDVVVIKAWSNGFGPFHIHNIGKKKTLLRIRDWLVCIHAIPFLQKNPFLGTGLKSDGGMYET